MEQIYRIGIDHGYNAPYADKAWDSAVACANNLTILKAFFSIIGAVVSHLGNTTIALTVGAFMGA